MNQPSEIPDNADLTDRVLGEFRLLRRLGKGGMAEVFLAEQTSLNRYVAIKILLPENAASIDADDVLLKRFQQEAKAAAGLSHPNIVQVYSIGEADGLHYIAQEYVEGTNLADYIKRHGPPDAALATHLMRQVAAALKAASEAGIVHRDIKPENIMLTRDGDAKVADFGLAQLQQAPEKLNLTQAGTTMGTPLYMSPEQVNGTKLDHRSDLYSFGVTAYHMLAGKPPFLGETAMAVAVQHLKDEAPPLSRQRADLPRELCNSIHRMMSKAPAARQTDAAAVLKELDQVANKLGNRTVRFSLNPAAEGNAVSRLFSSQRIKALGKTLLGIAAVGLVAAGIGRYMRPADDVSVTQSTFPVKETASEQFMYAVELGTNVKAWQAVIELFPDSNERNRAHSQLGKLYIDQQVRKVGKRNWRKAKSQYEILKKRGSIEPDLEARGIAGLAYIAAMEADYEQASSLLDDLDIANNNNGFGLESQTIEYGLAEEARNMIDDATTTNDETVGDSS